ncbi:hypothetical protein CQW23_28635 [Capsicum baccatum]|uniref:Uncharacterized protein n=1 Tax=Capsicum baccatum TaxID=33114 RepID=A0A2G2VH78_CAPBA|nr:hypothetical protein CQW23_28635 [Capsicum baccatum]
MSNYDGLVECRDDLDVRNMIVSYRMHKRKSIIICTLSKDCDITISASFEESISRNDASAEVVVMEEHESPNSTGPKVMKRKTRGLTRCIEIIKFQEGQKLSVEFDEDDQAIDKNATEFT